jgi:hypothetical protein
VSNVAWRAQPPDEAPDEPVEAREDAEVVDLTRQRLVGWVKGMFGGKKKQPPERDES